MSYEIKKPTYYIPHVTAAFLAVGVGVGAILIAKKAPDWDAKPTLPKSHWLSLD